MARAFRLPRRAEVADLLAEKRRYLASGSVMTEAAIDAGLFRDLYVAMGEPVGTRGRLGDTPALQAHGALDVARRNWRWGIGGLLTVTDRRYRHARQRSAAVRGVADAVQA
jgi:cytochrome c-type biogenesis protein CcmF